MADLFQLPKVVSLPGSKLYFYQTGTSTPQDTFQDATLTTPHANPVVADSNGVFEPIFLSPTLPAYRVTHRTSADVLIYTEDDYPSNQNVQQSMRLESTNPFVFLYDTDGTSGSRKYRIRAAGAAFEIQASNDAENTFTTILRHESGVLYSNATEVAVTESGSYTGTLTGMSGSVTGTIYYRRVNNVVTIYINSSLTGTSNSTSMTLTGMPAGIRPANYRFTFSGVVDNSNELFGNAVINTTGVVEFFLYSTATVANRLAVAISAFTGSGTKGLNSGWSLTYTIS